MIARDKPFDLRPLDYAGILDRTLELYRNNFVLLISIAAVLYVPFGIFRLLLAGRLPAASMTPENMMGLAAGGFFVAIGSWIITSLVHGAMIVAVSKRYLGLKTDMADSYREVMPVLVPLMLTSVIVGLLLIVGMFLLVIPFFIFLFWTAFYYEAVVLERKFYGAAIERSKYLIGDGQWVRVLVLGVLMFILVIVANKILGTVLSFLPGGSLHLTVLAESVMQTFIFPLQIVATIVLYYDIRVRKEAFDLQMLAAQLGGTVPATAPLNEPAWGGAAAPSTWGGQPDHQGAGYPPAYGAPPAQGTPPAYGAPPAQGVPPAWGPPAQGTPPAWGGQAPTQGAWNAPAQAPPAWGAPPPAGMPAPSRFCAFCGTPMSPDGAVCSRCGQTQPANS